MRDLLNRRDELMLHYGQPFLAACAIPLSEADRVIASPAFEQWQKRRETDLEMQTALLRRIDNVATAIGGLAKFLSRR